MKLETHILRGSINRRQGREHLLVEEVGSLGVALVFCVCVEHGQVLRVERHFVLTKGRIAQGERGLNGSRLRCHLIAGVGG